MFDGSRFLNSENSTNAWNYINIYLLKLINLNEKYKQHNDIQFVVKGKNVNGLGYNTMRRKSRVGELDSFSMSIGC